MAQDKWLIQPGETKTIDVEVVRSLKVGLIGGQIDIIGHDEPGARIEVHSVSGRDLKILVDGDRLEIDHPQLRWDNFIEVFKTMRSSAKADISVLVPRDVALKFGVVSASALVAGLETDAKLSTVSGDIVVDNVTGDLELNSVGGELSARDHRGRVVAHTVSGDVTVTGAIPKFSVDSVSGDVMVDITGTPDEISSNTVSGDLTVRIPEAVGARYQVNTVSGQDAARQRDPCGPARAARSRGPPAPSTARGSRSTPTPCPATSRCCGARRRTTEQEASA